MTYILIVCPACSGWHACQEGVERTRCVHCGKTFYTDDRRVQARTDTPQEMQQVISDLKKKHIDPLLFPWPRKRAKHGVERRQHPKQDAPTVDDPTPVRMRSYLEMTLGKSIRCCEQVVQMEHLMENGASCGWQGTCGECGIVWQGRWTRPPDEGRLSTKPFSGPHTLPLTGSTVKEQREGDG